MTMKESEERVIQALRKSRLGRLSYGNEEPGTGTGLMDRLSSSSKQNITSPPASTPPRRTTPRLSFPLTPGRTLYSPNDPNRPKELDKINMALVISPSHLDDNAKSDKSSKIVKEKPEERRNVGKVPLIASPTRLKVDEEDDSEFLKEFDAVLRIEDGLDEVNRELLLYEERAEEAMRASIEARVKTIRTAYAKFLREAEDRLRLVEEKAAEERRLRNLEAEKQEQLWRMEMQRLRERMKKSMESKAEELRSKTRDFEEELTREQNTLRARFDELINLEKSISEKIVEAVQKSGELSNLLGSGRAGAIVERVRSVVASARRSLDDVAAGRSMNASGTISDSDMQLLRNEEIVMTGCSKLLDDAIAQAEEERKQAEQKQLASQQQLQQQQLQLQQEQNQREEAAKEKQQLRVSQSGLKEYAQLSEKVEKYEEVAKLMAQDASLKKLRFQLQKAVNIPINAISNENSSNFRDMTQRLIRLLSGHPVDSGGDTTVAASSHPSGVPFCVDRVATVFIKQAEDQIASNPDAAFPMAAAIVSLWTQLPEWGEVFLGKLFHKCPYLVPYYPALPAEALAEDEATRAAQMKAAEGRILVNDAWEDDAQFFKRMGGVARLFGAIVQTRVGPNKKHPCGPDRGWRMLADIMRLPPKPGVTATILADFLATAGHRLSAVYSRQFAKLLITLRGPFRQNLGSGTPVVRLEEVIDSGLKRGGSIPAPKGVLTIVL